MKPAGGLLAKALPNQASDGVQLLRTVADVRKWRQQARADEKTVGFVATMGALHEGHLDLVHASVKQCDQTVVSIFVNPAQFAPTEDLAAYPRTTESDLEKLSALNRNSAKQAVHAVFLPAVDALYPSGIEQDVAKQTGTFVEVKGLSHQMEGGSRPTFFRGVATVVMKLFNIIQEPDWTFFGQKDIQQCFVLRQMLKDMHFTHPAPSRMVIVPTHRHPSTGLALSSRNAYLSPQEYAYAPCLYEALRLAEKAFKGRQDQSAPFPAASLREVALQHLHKRSAAAAAEGVSLKADYIAFNEPGTLRSLEQIIPGQGAVMSGALWCGTTRLIDNLVLDYDLNAP